MSLATSYLGLRLPHPLIVGSGPLTDDLDTVRELEDAGAAVFVLRRLYEEEIVREQMSAFFHAESHGESFAEAASYSPDPEQPFGPDEYLEHVRRVKQAVGVPVLAALDAVTPGGWLSMPGCWNRREPMASSSTSTTRPAIPTRAEPRSSEA